MFGHVFAVSTRMSSMLLFAAYRIRAPQEMQWMNSPAIFVDPFVGQPSSLVKNTSFPALHMELCHESHPMPYGWIPLQLSWRESPILSSQTNAPATGLKCSEWWTWNHFGISNSLSNQFLDFVDSWSLWSLSCHQGIKGMVNHELVEMVWLSVVRGHLPNMNIQECLWGEQIPFLWDDLNKKTRIKVNVSVSTLHSKHGENSLTKKFWGKFSSQSTCLWRWSQVPVPFSTIICDKFLWWFNNILPKSLPKELQKLTEEFDPWLLWRYRNQKKNCKDYWKVKVNDVQKLDQNLVKDSKGFVTEITEVSVKSFFLC